MRVLILRPEPGASATGQAVARFGCEPIVVPLFVALPVTWTLPEAEVDAVAMTSANAARLGGDGLRALTYLPLYAVGEATAAAARAAGFHDIVTSDGDVDDLAAMIPDGVRVAHLCGTERRPLTHGFVTDIAVYRTAVRPIDAATLAAIVRADVALVHASSAGRRLAELLPPGARGGLRVVAISARAADACGDGWDAIAVAAHPREDAMLALVASLCETAA